MQQMQPQPQPTPSLTAPDSSSLTLDSLASFAKRRGLIYPGSELYGGVAGTWDYGPLGTPLKDNVKAAWKRSVTQERDDVVLLDGATITHQRIWEASGHVANFSDPLRDCRNCRRRVRADQVPGDRCPYCGGELTEPRQFNLMLSTHVGPVEETANLVYLRPETAQVIFAQFSNVLQTTHQRIPFGIAQVGKAYRNEITPGNFTFRSREFEQMEIEFFCQPGTDEQWHQHWIDQRLAWYHGLGIRPENLRIRPHERDELAHYARACVDIEYRFPSIGWAELEGIANRTDFDLSQHAIYSGKDLRVHDPMTGERYTPFVIEPSAGADRATLAFLADAYRMEEVNGETRAVLGLHPRLAPIKVAVLPLSKKPELVEQARGIRTMLARRWMTDYDETQSIGRRYRRQDEIGTPFCVTIDFDTPQDQTVTVRNRDSMSQERLGISDLMAYLNERLDS